LSAPLERIPPREALAKMDEGYVYVDVRSAPEFEAGHPAGAVNVPFSAAPTGGAAEDDFVMRVLTRFGRDARLVVGCKSGHRSLVAARALVDAGFAHVVEQRAGWDGARDAFGQVTEPGWRRAGLPVETGDRG
jgi:rhodanese-related sulfurtransferase